jgi:tRNA-(ms[2]io[6]A)-hydroxylase
VLGLRHATDPGWAVTAVERLDELLVDHAHCELKAASNALALAGRSPGFPLVARALIDVAEEEIRHYRQVLDELDRRGVALGKPPVDEYAADLLKRAFASTAKRSAADSLADRLLVGALIEARSCERFRLLADELTRQGRTELAAFYEDLFAAEARHYRTFVDLAIEVRGEAAARARLAELAAIEAEVARGTGAGAAIHG